MTGTEPGPAATPAPPAERGSAEAGEAAKEALLRSEGHARSLLRLSRRLERASSYTDAVDAALPEVEAVLGYHNAWVYLLAGDGKTARLITMSGGLSPRVATELPTLQVEGDPFLEEIFRAEDGLLIEDARTDPRTDKRIVEQMGNRTLLNVPILLEDRRLGAFGTGSFGDEGVRVPTAAQRSFFCAMASHLAVTLERLHQQSARLAAEAEVRALNEQLEERVRERTAALHAANEELEAFAYSVSHDLRAPLRAIDGFSQALADEDGAALSAAGLEHLARIRAASQRMGLLIDDLLRLSRVGRGELLREPVDLSALGAAVAAELQRADPGRAVELVIERGLVSRGDPRLLRQVLENLLGNAWKFTAGRPRARIELGRRPLAERAPDGEGVYFVRDDGAGFDMAFADRLFSPFQRLHSAAEFAGTGVGLALVARIVRRHGGRVFAEGEVGRGATVYFTLPAGGGRR